MAKRPGRTSRRRQQGAVSAKATAKPAFPGDLGAAAPGRAAGPGSERRAAALLERHNRARLAAAAAREPLDYREGHRALSEDRGAAVKRFGPSLPDVRGNIGTPHRAYDTLATLRRNHSIGDAEYEAGREFEEDFVRARLDPLHAADPGRLPGGGAAELTDAMVAGRRRITRAMAALGGTAMPAGSAVWCILGTGVTVKEWAAGSQFGQAGRSLDEKVAKGVFLSALGVLAVHYGTRRR
ncbi:MAG: hypothetical protein OEM93_15765 [Rhodospirillales bacterium]|nr:hypothetical protein [Rhodospirillales bacterium]MDH3968978.1 hypothetical protein [Rhodospirillales bacterium]